LPGKPAALDYASLGGCQMECELLSRGRSVYGTRCRVWWVYTGSKTSLTVSRMVAEQHAQIQKGVHWSLSSWEWSWSAIWMVVFDWLSSTHVSASEHG